VEAQQRGYPLKEVAEATEELTAGQRPQRMGGTAVTQGLLRSV
jgi:hypothetical protein